MIGETMTVHRQGEPDGGFDDQGNPTVESGTSFTVDGMAFAPINATETAQDFGPQVITGYQCYRREPLTLRASDVLEIRGVRGWQVDGMTGDWVSPYSTVFVGVEFRVRRSS